LALRCFEWVNLKRDELAAASYLGENDTRLWRVLDHYVMEAHRKKDWLQVTRGDRHLGEVIE
jgi:hypothetical protein